MRKSSWKKPPQAIGTNMITMSCTKPSMPPPFYSRPNKAYQKKSLILHRKLIKLTKSFYFNSPSSLQSSYLLVINKVLPTHGLVHTIQRYTLKQKPSCNVRPQNLNPKSHSLVYLLRNQ